MGSKIGLPDLKMTKEDGSLLSRFEMETQLRAETVHHRRLRASKAGLPSKTAQSMLPISVTHWLLDHWVQHKIITGDIFGVSSEFGADDPINKDYLRQLAQRLMLFVENGLAVLPNPGEGIDMSFAQQPPGFPMPPAPNGQQGAPSFAPPAPPMPGMPMPGGLQPPAPPQMPGMPQMAGFPPQQGYPQQPVMGVVVPLPNGFPQPGGPQQGYPQQGGFPQQGMPQMPQPPMPPQPPQPAFQAPAPQQQQAPQQPGNGPLKADASRVWGQAGKREDGTQRTRRTKEELQEDANYEAYTRGGGDPNAGAPQQQAPQQPQMQMPAPQMMQQPQMTPQMPQQGGFPQPQQPPVPQNAPMLAPPNPFGAQGAGPLAGPQFPGQQSLMPQMPTGQQMPPQQMTPSPVQQQAAPVDLGPLEEMVAHLQKRQQLLETALAMALRVLYNKQGPADLYQVLVEVCGVNPQ